MKFLNPLRDLAFKVSAAVKAVASVIAAPIGFREVLLFGGAALLSVGVWPIYPPASFVIPGAILVYVSVFGTP